VLLLALVANADAQWAGEAMGHDAVDTALIDYDAPEVVLRTDPSSGDVVEEFHHGGVVYMVAVRPDRGAGYLLLDLDADGRLDTLEGELPAQAPAFWVGYDWE
jgi:hypothetical protein